MTSSDKNGGNKNKKSHAPKSAASTDPNFITFRDPMERKMATKLLVAWHTMPDLMGEKLCGSNPYQYARSLRNKSIKINYIIDIGERYGRYRVTDPASRVRLKNALAMKKKVG